MSLPRATLQRMEPAILLDLAVLAILVLGLLPMSQQFRWSGTWPPPHCSSRA